MYHSNLYDGTEFTVATAAPAAVSSAAIFTNLEIGWWSLLFCYIAMMATIEGGKRPVFLTQFFGSYECILCVFIVHCMLQ